MTFPEVVAQNRHRIRSRVLVLFRKEYSTRFDRRPEHGKVIPGNCNPRILSDAPEVEERPSLIPPSKTKGTGAQATKPDKTSL